jgi:hypothetical protein
MWLERILLKEGRRRHQVGKRVRIFVRPLKGKHTKTLRPHYDSGTIKGLEKRRYVVQKDDGTQVDVHPRDVVGE